MRLPVSDAVFSITANEGVERQGRSVVTVRRTYFAANEDEARALAEKENVTVLTVTDLLKSSK